MMRRLVGLAIVAALHSLVTTSVYASEVNYGYGIYGQAEMAPLQVFDNGKNLYMQWSPRRLASPPVPFNEDGTPIAYEIQGPYMVMGIRDRIILRAGSLKIYIQSAADAKARKNRSAGGGFVGRNVWYGAADPAQVTSSAPAPVRANSIPPAREAQATSLVATPEKRVVPPTSLNSGRFLVQKAGDEKADGGKGSASGREVIMPIPGALTVASLSLPRSKLLIVESDGSSAGYRKAQAIKKMLSPNIAVRILPVGAPAGYLRIASGA